MALKYLDKVLVGTEKTKYMVLRMAHVIENAPEFIVMNAVNIFLEKKKKTKHLWQELEERSHGHVKEGDVQTIFSIHVVAKILKFKFTLQDTTSIS